MQKNSPIKKTINAFTMAEILITLMILGFLFAITLPIMIKTYDKQVKTIQFRRAYALLSNITELSEFKNGGIPPGNNATADFNKYIRPFVKVTKDCGTGIENGNNRCFASPNGGWYNPNGVEYVTNGSAFSINSYYKVVLDNGMSLAYRTHTAAGNNVRMFFIDIDGPKKGYSKVGYDVFVFEWAKPWGDGCACKNEYQPRTRPNLSKPTLLPHVSGTMAAASQCQDGIDCTGALGAALESCYTANGGGWGRDGNGGWYAQYGGSGCSALVYLNKFKFPEDYPWELMSKKPANFRPIK